MKRRLKAFVVIIFAFVLVLSFEGCTDLDALAHDNVSEIHNVQEAAISDALTEAESNNEDSMTFEEFCAGIFGF